MFRVERIRMISTRYRFQRGMSEFQASIKIKKGLVITLTDLVIHKDFIVNPKYKDFKSLDEMLFRLQRGIDCPPLEIRDVTSKGYKNLVLQIFDLKQKGFIFIQVKKQDGGVVYTMKLRVEEIENIATEGLNLY